MSDRSYFGRVANNIERAFHVKEQLLEHSTWYYLDLRSLIKDLKTFQQAWKKFVAKFWRATGIKLFGIIEHQGTDPSNYHIHAVIITDQKVSQAKISEAWIGQAGKGSSVLLDPPITSDPYRKLRYILKSNYHPRGRKTKPQDKAINYHVHANFDSLPWSGEILPTNRFHHTKLKQLVRNYFPVEKSSDPVEIRSLVYSSFWRFTLQRFIIILYQE